MRLAVAGGEYSYNADHMGTVLVAQLYSASKQAPGLHDPGSHDPGSHCMI